MTPDIEKQLVSRGIKPPKLPEVFFWGAQCHQRRQECSEMILFFHLRLIYVEPKGIHDSLQCQSTWQMVKKTNANSPSSAFRIGKWARDTSPWAPPILKGRWEQVKGASGVLFWQVSYWFLLLSGKKQQRDLKRPNNTEMYTSKAKILLPSYPFLPSR